MPCLLGVFITDVKVSNTGRRPRFVTVRKALVDSGSEMTWIDGRTLRDAGVSVRKKDQRFVMANDQEITRDVGHALLGCGGFETVDEVVFAHEGDLQLLGARTLEGFNVVVDPRRKRLVGAGPQPAAGSD